MTRTIKISSFDSTKYLNSEESIVEYLDSSMEIGDPEVFIAALATAAKARGMTQLAKDAGVSRDSLYKTLAPGAKPRFETVIKITQALGVSLSATAQSPSKP